MKILNLETKNLETLIDFTDEALQYVAQSGIKTGTLTVQTPINTCAVISLSNRYQTTEKDYLSTIDKWLPLFEGWDFHGFGTKNIRASILGTSKTFLIENGTLLLGAYERLYFAEFDGPKKDRLVVLQAVGEQLDKDETPAHIPEIYDINQALIHEVESEEAEKERIIQEMREEYAKEHAKDNDSGKN